MEGVRGGHRGLDAAVAHGLLDVLEDLVPLGRGGVERHHVVVVKLEAVAIALGQSADAFQRGQLGARHVAERIPAAVLQTPDAKGELVFPGRSVEV